MRKNSKVRDSRSTVLFTSPPTGSVFLAQSNYFPWIPDKRKDQLWKKMDYRAYVKVEIIDHVSNVTMTSF